ncbi:uncharacterized protein [Leptinotarsa decemlineata]|uniref:uncharacterized protein n=1 Tax=Leptinotarsa decemlineata TaxID=7539 RepID=UPI003D30CBFF
MPQRIFTETPKCSKPRSEGDSGLKRSRHDRGLIPKNILKIMLSEFDSIDYENQFLQVTKSSTEISNVNKVFQSEVSTDEVTLIPDISLPLQYEATDLNHNIQVSKDLEVMQSPDTCEEVQSESIAEGIRRISYNLTDFSRVRSVENIHQHITDLPTSNKYFEWNAPDSSHHIFQTEELIPIHVNISPSPLVPIDSHKNNVEDTQVVQNSKARKLSMNKANICKYCHLTNTNIRRHITSMHKNEEEVKEFLLLAEDNPKKKQLLSQIRRDGNFCGFRENE